jgi:ribosomal protein S17E
MAKKNIEKNESNNEVVEVLGKVIINENETKVEDVVEKSDVNDVDDIVETEENVLEGSLTIDIDEFTKDVEEFKLEVVEKFESNPMALDTPTTKEVVEEQREKKNKTIMSRIAGYIWNGQEFDY